MCKFSAAEVASNPFQLFQPEKLSSTWGIPRLHLRDRWIPLPVGSVSKFVVNSIVVCVRCRKQQYPIPDHFFFFTLAGLSIGIYWP